MVSIPVDLTNGIIMEQHNFHYKSFSLSSNIISILKRYICTFVTITLYQNTVAIIAGRRSLYLHIGPINQREWLDLPLALTS